MSFLGGLDECQYGLLIDGLSVIGRTRVNHLLNGMVVEQRTVPALKLFGFGQRHCAFLDYPDATLCLAGFGEGMQFVLLLKSAVVVLLKHFEHGHYLVAGMRTATFKRTKQISAYASTSSQPAHAQTSALA